MAANIKINNFFLIILREVLFKSENKHETWQNLSPYRVLLGEGVGHERKSKWRRKFKMAAKVWSKYAIRGIYVHIRILIKEEKKTLMTKITSKQRIAAKLVYI